MFLFKKIISPFFLPLPLGLLMLLFGLILLWFTQRQKTGKILTTAGAGLISLMSYAFISSVLLGPLEDPYPPYGGALGLKERVEYVVVLGGGHGSDLDIPAVNRLDGDSMIRLMEGIRVYRENPGSRLILSGGGVFGSVPEAEIMREVARFGGVDPRDILLEPYSRDTEEQSRRIKPMVMAKPFALVTSTHHMRRAMGLFMKQGLKPVAAPSGYPASALRPLRPGSFFPKASALEESEKACHEYLGILWARLRGEL